MSSRPARVKNKTAAPVQITAEQILREASEHQEKAMPAPKQRIADQEELLDYQQKKRKTFEDILRRNRNTTSNWIKYASWEESQMEIERARSIYERGLDVIHRDPLLWIKYIEMEMRLKNPNHARNILDRAVTILPRIDQFWYKYVWMEELLGNVAGARQVFERWMAWEPEHAAWLAYINLEKKYNELPRARAIFERFVAIHPQPKNWLKWAKFEEENTDLAKSRAIYETCISTLGEEFIDQNMYVSFAKFECRQKEYERARAIFKYGLDKLSKEKAQNLYKEYVLFEKQFGDHEGIEDVVLQKRRIKYEEDIANNPTNYDTWFEYARLEETGGNSERIRDVYERAVAQVPQGGTKREWERYIYLWLFYAVWEETFAKDIERAKHVYEAALRTIPNKSFTFAKVWMMYAQFLVRRMDLTSCRKILGVAIGMCPKARLFKGYIELELQLREFDRVRTLYEKYLEWDPANCAGWIKYAELERMLGDIERARGIFEIAISQPLLDMPEYLWKAYIDFEVDESEWENARALYERLLERTDHVKVWISFAKFEHANVQNGDDASRLEATRRVFERAYDVIKQKGEEGKEERAFLLESWLSFEREQANGEETATVSKLVKRQPRVIKKRRRVIDPNTGEETALWEEYLDYVFPDDEAQKPSIKLLQMAHKWKKSQVHDGDSSDVD